MDCDLTDEPEECPTGYLPPELNTIELFGAKKLNQVFGSVSKAYPRLANDKKKRISHLVLQLEREVKQKDGYVLESGDGLNMVHKSSQNVIQNEPKKRLMTSKESQRRSNIAKMYHPSRQIQNMGLSVTHQQGSVVMKRNPKKERSKIWILQFLVT